MAICNKIQRESKRIAIGSLNKLIKLKIRSISSPSSGGVDFGETFTDWQDIWAYVKTVNGVTIFDDSNIGRDVSHDIYIRFIPDVTSEAWIEFPAQYGSTKDQYFDILKVENLNEENKFYRLRCALRGDSEKPINWT
jgi:SPP1 family predicted phage head-tail adaptor